MNTNSRRVTRNALSLQCLVVICSQHEKKGLSLKSRAQDTDCCLTRALMTVPEKVPGKIQSKPKTLLHDSTTSRGEICCLIKKPEILEEKGLREVLLRMWPRSGLNMACLEWEVRVLRMQCRNTPAFNSACSTVGLHLKKPGHCTKHSLLTVNKHTQLQGKAALQ